MYARVCVHMYVYVYVCVCVCVCVGGVHGCVCTYYVHVYEKGVRMIAINKLTKNKSVTSRVHMCI